MIELDESTLPPKVMAFRRQAPRGHHPDLALRVRMLDGDQRAFEEFSDRIVPALYRFAASRLGGDRELTRDLVQTTVCKALARLDSYRAEASLLTWLCACCRNEIAMHFRKLGTRPRETPLGEEPDQVLGAAGALPPTSETSLLEGESAAWVHTTLDRISPHYADALQWKYIERLSVVEIAERLGMSPKAAESTLTRARSAFRGQYIQLMQELDLPSTLGAPGGLAAVRTTRA